MVFRLHTKLLQLRGIFNDCTGREREHHTPGIVYWTDPKLINWLYMHTTCITVIYNLCIHLHIQAYRILYAHICIHHAYKQQDHNKLLGAHYRILLTSSLLCCVARNNCCNIQNQFTCMDGQSGQSSGWGALLGLRLFREPTAIVAKWYVQK